jgi:uncharacterized RDD family membrane protein YckC
MMRFDEVELDAGPTAGENAAAEIPETHAPRMSRFAALLTDLSLFVAVVFLLLPLLSEPPGWLQIGALAGFVVMLSFYYCVGSWMLWGKTVGGAIFDVRVVAAGGHISLRDASLRWAGVYLSLATAGLGFALALLPSRRSLPDLLSGTHCGR